MLTLDHLTLSQGDFRLVADIKLQEGSHTAIMGPSGGGKSTLLMAIAGFLTPMSGRVLWRGQDMTALPPGERPVSILFQDNNLFPHLTIAQNVGLGLAPRLRHGPVDRARIEDALASTGLAGLGDRRPAALSGGQQSRAALARIILSNRPLVLLDEPFAALGPGLRHDMLDLARETLGAAGRTILLVTHAPDDARYLGGDLVVVADGQVSEPQKASTLLDTPTPALRAYLGSRSPG